MKTIKRHRALGMSRLDRYAGRLVIVWMLAFVLYFTWEMTR